MHSLTSNLSISTPRCMRIDPNAVTEGNATTPSACAHSGGCLTVKEGPVNDATVNYVTEGLRSRVYIGLRSRVYIGFS